MMVLDGLFVDLTFEVEAEGVFTEYYIQKLKIWMIRVLHLGSYILDIYTAVICIGDCVSRWEYEGYG